MKHTDSLQRFLFEESSVKGQLVCLQKSYSAIYERHQYPELAAIQLGQALAASVLISTSLKFQGSFILQAQTTGAVNLLVAQCTQDLHIRGLAKWDEDLLATRPDNLLGSGQLVITVIPTDQKNRYQGIVALEGQNLACAIENYFTQSEQIPTRLWLIADMQMVCGLLLQKMPSDNAEDWAYWEHISILADTITKQELLHLPTETVLHRLFYEENIRLFDSEPVAFRCQCNIDKMENALKMYGEQAVAEIFLTQQAIDVTCEFCNRQYSFDKVDVARIFHPNL